MKMILAFSALAVLAIVTGRPVFAQEAVFTQEELEQALNYGNDLTQTGRDALSGAIAEDALLRDKSDATFICYDGTNPSSSGLGTSIVEAKKDAKLRRAINACLSIHLYMSTNDCRKALTLNLPPNTHPKKTIETLLSNDSVTYPQMKDNGTLEKCLGDKAYQDVDPRRLAYIQLYVGHMVGSPELPKCGPIGKSYKWILNASGKPQLFRGDRGYQWGHVYDNGIDRICGK